MNLFYTFNVHTLLCIEFIRCFHANVGFYVFLGAGLYKVNAPSLQVSRYVYGEHQTINDLIHHLGVCLPLIFTLLLHSSRVRMYELCASSQLRIRISSFQKTKCT